MRNKKTKKRQAAHKIVRAPKIARDITARKRAQAALRESEALKTGMLNAALDPIITINEATEVLEFNPAAERIFGYARQDAIGKRVGDLIVPAAHREAHNRGVARYLTTGESRILGRGVELSAMRADGSQFPCELAISPVRLEGQLLFTPSSVLVLGRYFMSSERRSASTKLTWISSVSLMSLCAIAAIASLPVGAQSNASS